MAASGDLLLAHALPCLLAAAAVAKLALAWRAVPRLPPVVGIDVATLVIAPALARLLVRRELVVVGAATLAVALVSAEAMLFLPVFLPGDQALGAYLALSFVQGLLALFAGSLASHSPVRFALLGVALVGEYLATRRVVYTSSLSPYLVAMVNLVVFGLAVQLRLIVDRHRGTVALLAVQRQLNQQLAMASRRLLEQEKQAVLARMTAGIAHEINNPVNHARGNLTFLARHLELLAALAERAAGESGSQREVEWARRDAQAIIRTSREALTRIADIVTGLRRLFGAPPSVLDTHDVAGVLRQALDYEALAPSQGIRYVTSIAGPAPLRCNPSDLQVVFANLLANAREAMGGQGAIEVRLRASTGSVVVVFEDDGPGIPPDRLARVFDLFYSTKAGGQNMGVGLPLCRSIVEQYGGTISIESEERRFTRVTVTLRNQGAPCKAS